MRKEKFGYSPGKRLTRQGIELVATTASVAYVRNDVSIGSASDRSVAPETWRMEMARELRTLRISVTQQPVLRAAVIPRDSCRRAWVTALTGPCSVYDQLNRSEYGRYSYLATIPSDPRSRFLLHRRPRFPVSALNGDPSIRQGFESRSLGTLER